jgi:hypothetical protein
VAVSVTTSPELTKAVQVRHKRYRPEEHKRPYFYSMLTLEYGVQANVWYGGWLQQLLERVELGDMEVLSIDELIGRTSISNNQE